MALNTIGSIATHIAESFVLPLGVSGNLVETVDMARIDVQNYTNVNIGSNGIDEKYQSPIVNLSKAQALNEAFAWAATVSTSGGAVIMASGTSDVDDLQLGELTVKAAAEAQTNSLNYLSNLSKDTPNQFREMANETLKSIGRRASFARSLS